MTKMKKMKIGGKFRRRVSLLSLLSFPKNLLLCQVVRLLGLEQARAVKSEVLLLHARVGIVYKHPVPCNVMSSRKVAGHGLI